MIGDLQQRNINAAFNTLDVTGDDHIDQDDFRVRADRLRMLRPGMDEKLARELQKTFDDWWEVIRRAADSDGDGRVTREEFTAAIDAGLEEDPVYVDQMTRVAQVVAEAADLDGDGILDRPDTEDTRRLRTAGARAGSRRADPPTRGKAGSAGGGHRPSRGAVARGL